MVQNFTFFADRSAAAKIKTAKIWTGGEIVIKHCGAMSAQRWRSVTRKLKGWQSIPRKFAPMKISRYTVLSWFCWCLILQWFLLLALHRRGHIPLPHPPLCIEYSYVYHGILLPVLFSVDQYVYSLAHSLRIRSINYHPRCVITETP